MNDYRKIRKYLLKNASDYIERSIRSFSENDYKIAVLFLWSGILLFLKIRLFDINPVLIYEKNIFSYDKKQSNPVFAQFDSTGNKKTLNFSGIIDRFKYLQLETSLFDFKTELENIQRIRNRIEHYIDDIDELQYSGVIERILPFFNSFIEGELGEPLSELLPSWDTLLEIKSFYLDRVSRMKELISSFEYAVLKDGGDFPKAKCPNCEDGIMIHEGVNLYCPVCDFSSDFAVCKKCGVAYLMDDWTYFNEDTGVCDDCFEFDMRE